MQTEAVQPDDTKRRCGFLEAAGARILIRTVKGESRSRDPPKEPVNFMVVSFFLVGTRKSAVIMTNEEVAPHRSHQLDIKSRLSYLGTFKDTLPSGFIVFLPQKGFIIQINLSCPKNRGPGVL